MAGTMSIRRDRAAGLVISFFEEFEDEMVAGAKARLFRFLREGEAEPDLRLILRLVSRQIEHDLGEVIRTDKAALDEQANDIQPRLELTEAGGEVQQQLVQIRPILVGFLGEERVKEILATDGRTAQVSQTHELWRQGEHTLERLRRGNLEAEGQTTGVEFKPKEMADGLEPPVVRMRQAQKRLARERRKYKKVVIAKGKAMTTFDTDFRGSVRLGVGLCLLGALPELATTLDTSALRPPQRGSSRGDGASEEVSSAPEKPESPEPEAAETPDADSSAS